MPAKSKNNKLKRKKTMRCKAKCKNCGKKYKLKKCCKNHEKKCKTKRCVKNTRKFKRIKRKLKKKMQRGCSKQRGGSDMGETFTGYKRNLYNMEGSLLPKTTQSDIPIQQMNGGGLLSQRTIDFGLGNALTFMRDGQNVFKNIGRTWYGDHHVESANPVVPSKDMDMQTH